MHELVLAFLYPKYLCIASLLQSLTRVMKQIESLAPLNPLYLLKCHGSQQPQSFFTHSTCLPRCNFSLVAQSSATHLHPARSLAQSGRSIANVRPYRHSKAALGVHQMSSNDRSTRYRYMTDAEPTKATSAADVFFSSLCGLHLDQHKEPGSSRAAFHFHLAK